MYSRWIGFSLSLFLLFILAAAPTGRSANADDNSQDRRALYQGLKGSWAGKIEVSRSPFRILRIRNVPDSDETTIRFEGEYGVRKARPLEITVTAADSRLASVTFATRAGSHVVLDRFADDFSVMSGHITYKSGNKRPIAFRRYGKYRNEVFPNFVFVDPKGTEWQLTDLRGKVILISHFASWCPPCLRELPDLEVIAKRYRNSPDVKVLVFNRQEQYDVSAQHLRFNNLDIELMKSGRGDGHLYRRNGGKVATAHGLPQSTIIDRDGVIQHFQGMIKSADAMIGALDAVARGETLDPHARF